MMFRCSMPCCPWACENRRECIDRIAAVAVGVALWLVLAASLVVGWLSLRASAVAP
jgi:hypothetical protein